MKIGAFFVCLISACFSFCEHNLTCNEELYCIGRNAKIENISIRFPLRNSKPAAFNAYLYCHEVPNNDIMKPVMLTNTFDVSNGGAFGVFSFAFNESATACVPDHNKTIFLNRDMSFNIFHLLYNVGVPFFRCSSNLNFDDFSLRIIDGNAISENDHALFSAIFGSRYAQSQSDGCFEEAVFGLAR